MSIVSCDGKCGAYIDTDFDTESYDKRLEKWFCHICREEPRTGEDFYNQAWLKYYQQGDVYVPFEQLPPESQARWNSKVNEES